MSSKNLDKHNRWRNRTVAFRMSPEEDEHLETLVRLSGLTKQDYIIQRLLERDVVVSGNIRIFKSLNNEIADILDELKRINSGEKVDEDLQDTIRFVANILDRMKED